MMKRGIIVGLVVALLALGVAPAFAFGPGPGMGMGAGYGACMQTGGTSTPEQAQKYAKFQSDILPLKQKMLQLRTELMTLRAQTPTDWNAISAKQKEMVDVRTQIQKAASDNGFAGFGCRRCGDDSGRMGMGAGMGMGRMGM